MAQQLSGGTRFRSLQGSLNLLAKSLLIAIPVVGIFFLMDTPSYLGLEIYREQYYGLFIGLNLVSIFLLVPPTASASRTNLPWYDAILCLLSAVVAAYVVIFFPYIAERVGTITPDRIILGVIAIALVLEAVRRMTGWFVFCLALAFIFYGRYTFLFPGLLSGPGIQWDRLINSLFLDNNAMLGIPIAIGSTIVVAFVLFGNMLFGVGGGHFISDLAMALFGRYRGGPAKIAVVASSLFGTVSGSAVANVVTSGTITIPLMKKAGYKPHMAGAIEATASTGGQILPPIMGAAAFLIAEYTGIPYRETIIAAFIPGLLYYVNVFIQVDLEAAKYGILGLPPEQLPRVKEPLKQSYLFVIPLFVLIFGLFAMLLSPSKAALLSVASILVLGIFIQPKTRFRLPWIIDAFEKTGKSILELGSIVALAGIIIGVISFTGIGFVLPLFLDELSGGNVYILLFLVAGMSLVLGMGMPTVPVYILLAVLMAPPMVALGINLLGAHLFILYFGVLSQITPPICVAAFAGAAIAQSDPMRTGLSATRLGVLAYPIPFLFALFPVFLLRGSLIEIVLSIGTILPGSLMLGCSLVGFLYRRIGTNLRLLMALSAVLLIIPAATPIFKFGLLTDIIGAALFLLIYLKERGLKQGR
jgi:TRAP transporter 4TM/12TM fusion protein